MSNTATSNTANRGTNNCAKVKHELKTATTHYSLKLRNIREIKRERGGRERHTHTHTHTHRNRQKEKSETETDRQLSRQRDKQPDRQDYREKEGDTQRGTHREEEGEGMMGRRQTDTRSDSWTKNCGMESVV